LRSFAARLNSAPMRRAQNNGKLKIQNSKLQKLTGLLLDWFSQNARDLPWRRTRDPYAIWVSEIMLQQTQVKTVMPYWERWMRELPTIKTAANASPDKIHKLWEGLGYYTRVRNLQKAARQIVEKHNGKFPQNFDDVLALPGIGRYTAGAICSIAFNQPTPILDGNVIRVLTRVFGIGKNPREKKTNAQLWRLAEELVVHVASSPSICRRRRKESHSISLSSQRLLTSSPTCSHFNQSLMELGALVCTPRQPKCPECPVRKLCVAFQENRVAELPNLGRRTAATARRFVAFVVERQGRFLVRQRPAGVVNAHLWEFPNVECNGANAKDIFKSIFGMGAPVLQPLCTVKHSITRYRITLEAFRVQLGGRSSTTPKILGTRRARPSENNGVWLTPAKLDSLALTGAHRKILERLNSKMTQPANGDR
jgi:A/G-specific adenine glycosylase